MRSEQDIVDDYIRASAEQIQRQIEEIDRLKAQVRQLQTIIKLLEIEDKAKE